MSNSSKSDGQADSRHFWFFLCCSFCVTYAWKYICEYIVLQPFGAVMETELDEFSVSCAIFIGSTEIVLSSLICILRDTDFQDYLRDESFTFWHSDNLFSKTVTIFRFFGDYVS